MGLKKVLDRLSHQNINPNKAAMNTVKQTVQIGLISELLNYQNLINVTKAMVSYGMAGYEPNMWNMLTFR